MFEDVLGISFGGPNTEPQLRWPWVSTFLNGPRASLACALRRAFFDKFVFLGVSVVALGGPADEPKRSLEMPQSMVLPDRRDP